MTWLAVDVLDIREGATYEGVSYDQDIVVRTTAGGALLTLFDMSPMIAQNVRPGDRLEVVVAISVPSSLRRGGTALLTACDVHFSPNDWEGFRDDLLRRPLCVWSTSDGDLVITTSELPTGFSLGDRFVYDDARLDLLAWRRTGSR
jgi:hypothetical protein